MHTDLHEFFAPRNKIIFYPGSSTDLTPLLIPALNGKGERASNTFVFCDPADFVASWFQQFVHPKGLPVEMNTRTQLPHRYRRFLDSLELRSVTVQSMEGENQSPANPLRFSLRITYKDGATARPMLFLYPVDAAYYLNKIHEQQFDQPIHTVIYVNQRQGIKTGSNHFLSPSVFPTLFRKKEPLKETEYLLTDQPASFSDASWDNKKIHFPGWGLAGNSMIKEQSACILKRSGMVRCYLKSNMEAAESSSQYLVGYKEADKISAISQKLNELEFKW